MSIQLLGILLIFFLVCSRMEREEGKVIAEAREDRGCSGFVGWRSCTRRKRVDNVLYIQIDAYTI